MTAADVAPLVALQERSYARRSNIRGSWPPERAMDGERLAAFLTERIYCVVATARHDGRPQAAPVGFSVLDGAFWLATVAGARLRNLRATPYVSLVVMEGERGSHRAVAAEGPVELHAPEDVRGRLDAVWRERLGRAPDWAAAFVELRPALLFSHDATA